MDDVTRELVNLIKKSCEESRNALIDIKDAIRKNAEATEKSAEAEKEQSQANALVISAINKPQSQLHEYRAREETQEVLGWIKLAVEVAMLFVVAAYATVSALQLIEMKKTTDTASRQLEMTERPWIRGTAIPSFDMIAKDGYFSWAVSVGVENLGQSVATDIFPRTELIAPGGDFIDGPRKRAKQLCEDAARRAMIVKSDRTLWDSSLFPRDQTSYPQNVILDKGDVDKAVLNGGAGIGKSVSMMLVGCIVYDYPTSLRWHETGFVYTIIRNDDENIPKPSRIFFPIDKPIPKDKLSLIKNAEFAN
jgi:hypothetical protein